MALLSKDTTRLLRKILLIAIAVSFLGLFILIVINIWFPYMEDILLMGKLYATAVVFIIFCGTGLIFVSEKESDDALKDKKYIN